MPWEMKKEEMIKRQAKIMMQKKERETGGKDGAWHGLTKGLGRSDAVIRESEQCARDRMDIVGDHCLATRRKIYIRRGGNCSV